MWKDTDQVKTWVNKVKNNGSGDDGEIDETGIKKLCENGQVTKKLSEEDSYQEKYIVIRDVCDSSLDLSAVPDDNVDNQPS